MPPKCSSTTVPKARPCLVGRATISKERSVKYAASLPTCCNVCLIKLPGATKVKGRWLRCSVDKAYLERYDVTATPSRTAARKRGVRLEFSSPRPTLARARQLQDSEERGGAADR